MSEVINVPDGWELKSLNSFVKLITKGSTPTSYGYYFQENGINFIKAESINKFGEIDYEKLQFIDNETNEFLKRSQLQENDLVFSIAGVLGRVAILKKETLPANTNQALAIIRLKDKSIKYLYYFLQSEYILLQIKSLNVQMAQANLSLENLNNFNILIPKEKKEQEKIAKILSTLDTAIESTQKLIDKEKNTKKGLMNDLLQNGIDKNGKIRTPKTHKYKDSELGPIPEEWEVVNLKKIGNVITGNTPSTDVEEYYNGNIPFIGPIDFRGQKYILNTEKTLTFEGLNNSREIPKNSILTVCIGSTIGKIALSITKCCTNQQVNTLICNKEYFHEFIYYLMKHFLLKQLNIEAGLQAVPIVNKSSFEKLILPCSLDLEEQKQIAKILNIQDKKIEKEEENLAKLKELKKGLMSDLLSGKVRVKV